MAKIQGKISFMTESQNVTAGRGTLGYFSNFQKGWSRRTVRADASRAKREARPTSLLGGLSSDPSKHDLERRRKNVRFVRGGAHPPATQRDPSRCFAVEPCFVEMNYIEPENRSQGKYPSK